MKIIIFKFLVFKCFLFILGILVLAHRKNLVQATVHCTTIHDIQCTYIPQGFVNRRHFVYMSNVDPWIQGISVKPVLHENEPDKTALPFNPEIPYRV